MENNLELEVKILNYDLDKLKKNILSKGGEYTNAEKQLNIYFNSKDFFLSDDEQLRIRIVEFINGDINKEFTYKKRLNNKGIRENIELNTYIDDEKNLIETLHYLGYEEVRRAYKHRETYIFKGQKVEFDTWDKETLPYSYAEIEVDNENVLEEIIDILEIPRDCVSTKSIRDLVNDL